MLIEEIWPNTGWCSRSTMNYMSYPRFQWTHFLKIQPLSTTWSRMSRCHDVASLALATLDLNAYRCWLQLDDSNLPGKKWMLHQTSILNGLFGVPGLYWHVAPEFLNHRIPSTASQKIQKDVWYPKRGKNNVTHHINLREIPWCSIWFWLRCRTAQDLNRCVGNFIWALNVCSEWPVDLENLPTSDKKSVKQNPFIQFNIKTIWLQPYKISIALDPYLMHLIPIIFRSANWKVLLPLFFHMSDTTPLDHPPEPPPSLPSPEKSSSPSLEPSLAPNFTACSWAKDEIKHQPNYNLRFTQRICDAWDVPLETVAPHKQRQWLPGKKKGHPNPWLLFGRVHHSFIP